jgi:Zn ribbon nucleic-acid-binding protein
METKNCQNCKKEFNIEPEDFLFYEKMKVPAPTWCSDCRMMRRMAFMNIFSLYKRNCDKCGVGMVSMFHKDKPYIVYCSKCWWADEWSGTEFSIDYDNSKSFWEQLIELHKKTPFMAVDTLYSSLVGTTYTNYSSHLKNCYALCYADYCENSSYSEFLNGLHDSSDCYRVKESELLYGCVGMHKCSRAIFSEECDGCVNVNFSKNCYGCTDCFGCMNLRNKSYCVFNEQLTKEKYFEFMSKINLNSFSEVEKCIKQSREFWLKYPVRSTYGNSLNVNTSGDYVYESKNTHDAYMATGAEDSRYVQWLSVGFTKDAYDYTCWGGNAQQVVDSFITGHDSAMIKFSGGCYPNALNNEYSFYASGCKNVFGCMNLKKKDYCILNKQYSKEEYENVRAQIIENMNTKPFVGKAGQVYKYGEMFPLELSHFGYNETIANIYFPSNEKDVATIGLGWFESEQNQYEATIQSKDLSDIRNDDTDITKEIIQCECGKCYRIVPGELNVIKKLNIPLPHKCPECRRQDRFARVNPPRLYKRECAKCSSKITTAYDANRPEIVYCESCYQQEVL